MKKVGYFILFLSLGFLACQKSELSGKEEIRSFLAVNGINAIDTLGIFIHIDKLGSDLLIQESSIVVMDYDATYLDGVVFDRSENNPTEVSVINLIKGLQNGLSLLGKGASASIYVPFELGFGKNPPFGVRHNANLVYNVYILDVK